MDSTVQPAWPVTPLSASQPCVWTKSLQSCPTLCGPMDCSHQAPVSMGSPGKNTGVVAMPSSRGSSRPRDGTCFSCISCIGRQRDSLPLAPPGKPLASSERKIVAHFCPTLCDPMDCGLPCSSVHGLLQARILGSQIIIRKATG